MRIDLGLLLMVKYPVPGQVKTRLAATIGEQLASDLYHHFVDITVATSEAFACGGKFAAITPRERSAEFAAMFPTNWHLFPQVESPLLGDRIHAAVEEVLRRGYCRVLTLGTDIPALPVEVLAEAAEALKVADVVLGPAEDGGYYLIGLKEAPMELFQDITWSTELVLAQTLAAAQRLSLRTHLLPVLCDVDDLASLHKYVRATSLPPDLAHALQPYFGNAE